MHLTAGGVYNSIRRADQWTASEGKNSDLRTPIDCSLEELLLCAGPNTHTRADLPLDLVCWGDLLIRHRVSFAEKIARQKVPCAELFPAIIHSDLDDIVPAIRERVTTAGTSATEAAKTLGGVGLLQLVESLPTRRVTNILRASRHIHPRPHQKWKANDLIGVV